MIINFIFTNSIFSLPIIKHKIWSTFFIVIIAMLVIIPLASNISICEASLFSNITSQSKIPVDHIIVVMQGGRSFDNYFGTYPGVNGLSKDTNIPVNPFDFENLKYMKPFHLEGVKTTRPLSDYKFNVMAYNNGSMDGFIHTQNLYGRDGNNVIGYYDYRDIPYYWNLASKYVLADNFFSATMRSGLVNYLHLYAGETQTFLSSFIPPQGIDIYTIFDSLEKKNIDWKVYMRNYDSTINYTNKMVTTKQISDTQIMKNPLLAIPRFVQNQTLNSHITDAGEYFNDLVNNSLPNVAYIMLPGLNEQAPSNLATGQEFVASLVFNLMKSQYWKNSVFILTYDGAGGWYDHVAPPMLKSTDKNIPKFGFRVPTLIISPYAKEGYIDNTLYDTTSILKFIEYTYGISPLSNRDAVANNLLNAFEFNKPPREPFIPPKVYTPPLDSQNQNQEDGIPSPRKFSSDTVQMIYGTGLAITVLLFLGIISLLQLKKIKISGKTIGEMIDKKLKKIKGQMTDGKLTT